MPTKLHQKVNDKIHDMTHLRIRTIVGDVTKRSASARDLDPTPESPMAVSCIDLVDGDITTVIPPRFLEEDYAAVYQLHRDREQQGVEIIHRNIETIKALLVLAKDYLPGVPPAGDDDEPG